MSWLVQSTVERILQIQSTSVQSSPVFSEHIFYHPDYKYTQQVAKKVSGLVQVSLVYSKEGRTYLLSSIIQSTSTASRQQRRQQVQCSLETVVSDSVYSSADHPEKKYTQQVAKKIASLVLEQCSLLLKQQSRIQSTPVQIIQSTSTASRQRRRQQVQSWNNVVFS